MPLESQFFSGVFDYFEHFFGDESTETDVRDLVRKYLRPEAKIQDEHSGTYRASAKSET